MSFRLNIKPRSNFSSVDHNQSQNMKCRNFVAKLVTEYKQWTFMTLLIIQFSVSLSLSPSPPLSYLSLASRNSVSAVVDPCNSNTVSLNNSYIVNPGYPGDASSGSSACTGSGVARSGRTAGTTATYTWNITKAATDVSI